MEEEFSLFVNLYQEFSIFDRWASVSQNFNINNLSNHRVMFDLIEFEY